MSAGWFVSVLSSYRFKWHRLTWFSFRPKLFRWFCVQWLINGVNGVVHWSGLQSVSYLLQSTCTCQFVRWVIFVVFVDMATAKTDVTQSSSLSPYKWLTFASMYVGYTLSVVNRKCFSFALPAIISSLHLEKDDVGMIHFTFSFSQWCDHCLLLSALYFFCEKNNLILLCIVCMWLMEILATNESSFKEKLVKTHLYF